MPVATAWGPPVEAAFVAEIRASYEARGQDPAGGPAATTIRTNTDLVPTRADNLLRLLGELGDLGHVGGLRVLEGGSGFGALAAYLALQQGAEQVVGVDIRADLVEAATRAVASAGIAGVSFTRSDLRELAELPAGAFDVAFLNNALLYLVDRDDVERCARAMARVLTPGGFLLVYQANRWRARDPFTGAPVMHLLPPGPARLLGRLPGLTSDHDRVRLHSPAALARTLRRAGFQSTRTAGLRRSAVRHGLSAQLAPWIAVLGRAPGRPQAA